MKRFLPFLLFPVLAFGQLVKITPTNGVVEAQDYQVNGVSIVGGGVNTTDVTARAMIATASNSLQSTKANQSDFAVLSNAALRLASGAYVAAGILDMNTEDITDADLIEGDLIVAVTNLVATNSVIRHIHAPTSEGGNLIGSGGTTALTWGAGGGNNLTVFDGTTFKQRPTVNGTNVALVGDVAGGNDWPTVSNAYYTSAQVDAKDVAISNAITGGSGDNLGSHTATSALNMAANNITNALGLYGNDGNSMPIQALAIPISAGVGGLSFASTIDILTSQDIAPSVSNSVGLGAADRPWHSLYLKTNNIVMVDSTNRFLTTADGMTAETYTQEWITVAGVKRYLASSGIGTVSNSALYLSTSTLTRIEFTPVQMSIALNAAAANDTKLITGGQYVHTINGSDLNGYLGIDGDTNALSLIYNFDNMNLVISRANGSATVSDGSKIHCGLWTEGSANTNWMSMGLPPTNTTAYWTGRDPTNGSTRAYIKNDIGQVVDLFALGGF